MAGYELLSDQGFRADGRKPHELRQIECRLGVFRQSDGSSYLEQGNCKVLATVYGPHETRGGRYKPLHDRLLVNCEYSKATFSTAERRKQIHSDRKAQEMSSYLRQTLEATIKTELYPFSQVDVFVEVLQADGDDFCTCVNAAMLAVVDAGIPIKDYVCACTSGLVNDTAIVDINYVERVGGSPELKIALLPRSEEIVLLEMSSRVHVDNLEKLLEAATKGCKDIYAIFDGAVRNHVNQAAASLGL